MLGKFEAMNFIDENGKPAGGHVVGIGLTITWQDGPLGRGEGRKEPNGAFVETVIAAVIQRVEYYQAGEFACVYNEHALKYLKDALMVFNDRTKDRESREVEGTHTV